MNKHQQINELLPAFVLGELDGPQAGLVQQHLAECPQCCEEAGRIEALLLQTEQWKNLSADEAMCQSAGRNVLSAAKNEEMQPPQQGPRSPVALIWRIVMKNGFTKIAVAAAVILAALLGIHLFTGNGSGKLYANVVETLHNARTLTYSTITRTGLDSIQTIRTDLAFKEPSHLRVSQPDGQVMVMDYTPGNGKIIGLMPATKTCFVIELSKIPDSAGKDPWAAVGLLRNLPARADEALGRREIDGRTLDGFLAREGDTATTVWIDPKTGNLIRAEIEYANAPAMNTILTDFRVDVDLDDSLFSLTPPEGYHLEQAAVDAGTVTEKDFIELLRMWSVWTKDGTFPPTVQRPDFFRVAVQMGQEGKLKGPDAPGYESRQRDIILRGMTFMGIGAGDSWRYAGQNVPFGNPATPIFWYRPAGSATYRVIYADLSVKDVPPEALPQ